MIYLIALTGCHFGWQQAAIRNSAYLQHTRTQVWSDYFQLWIASSQSKRSSSFPFRLAVASQLLSELAVAVRKARTNLAVDARLKDADETVPEFANK
jgi:hypothetical protein